MTNAGVIAAWCRREGLTHSHEPTVSPSHPVVQFKKKFEVIK